VIKILVLGTLAIGSAMLSADEKPTAQITIKKEAKPIPFLTFKSQKLELREDADTVKVLILRVRGSYDAKGTFLLNEKKNPVKGKKFNFDIPLTQDETEIRMSVVGATPQETFLSRIRIVLSPGLVKRVPSDPSRIQISVLDENQVFPQRKLASVSKETFQLAGLFSVHASTSSTLMYPVVGVGMKVNLQPGLFVRVPLEAWLITKTNGRISPVVSPLLLGGMEWENFFGELGGGVILLTEVNRVWVVQADVGYVWPKAFFSFPLGVVAGYRAHFSGGTRDSVFFGGLSFSFY